MKSQTREIREVWEMVSRASDRVCMSTTGIGYTCYVLRGRLTAGRQTLDLVVVVRIHPR